MKSRKRICLCSCLCLLLFSPIAFGETYRASQRPIPVVFDTDIGTDIDDTWALAYLLKCPELELKMVLTSTGNTTYRATVAAKLLELAGRSDVRIGIGPYEGSWNEFQAPWVEGYELGRYPGDVQEDGVQAFIDMVHASDVPITLIAVGALASVQAALEKDPSIAQKIRFYGMHGSIDRGYDHGTGIAAEANVRSNVPAFRRALNADWLHAEITPLDTCGRVVIGGENYQRLKHSTDPVLQAVFENYRIWADLVTWMDIDDAFYQSHSSTLFDLVAVYMAFDHRFLEFESVPVWVTDDGFTLRNVDRGTPIDCAMDWTDLDAFYQHVTERLLKNERRDR